jgi:hypothetical protein
LKRWLALAATVALLTFLFLGIDRADLMRNFASTRMSWFLLALGLFVPQIGIIALRWKRMVDLFTPITWGESVGLILAGNTMNLVLPSKLGDLSKGWFLHRMGALDLKRAMNVVVFEKMLDVAALALFMLAGVVLLLMQPTSAAVSPAALLLAGLLGLAAVGGVAVLYFVPLDALPGMKCGLAWLGTKPRATRVYRMLVASHEVMALLQSRGARRGRIIALSLTIWVFHLLQIYCFFRSLDAVVGPGQFSSLVPLAIFIGLIPLTIAGFGTRDGALQAFFPQYPPEVMLAVAMYVNLRYILPALAGIPFMLRYMAWSREARAAREAQIPSTGEPMS